MSDTRDRAYSLFNDNQLSQAAELFSLVSAADDHVADDWYMLAVIQSMQGDYHDALHTCQRALQTYPSDVRINYVLAYSYQHLGRTDDAIPQYQHTLALAPDLVEASLNLAGLFRQNHRHGQALAECLRGLQYQPDNSALLLEAGTVCALLEQYDDAIGHFQRALAIEPGLVDASFNLAKAYEKQGQLEQAAHNYQQVLAHDPTDIQCLNDLAVVYTRLEHYGDAVIQLQQALQLQPDFAVGWNNLGTVYYEQGDIEQALAHFEKAFNLQPDYAEACNNMGACLLELGEFSRALACYEQALVLDPAYKEAAINRARLLTNLGHLDEALSSIDNILRQSPAHAEAVAVRLMILARRGDTDTLRAGLLQARNHTQDSLFLTAAIADNCRLLDCCDESIADLRRVLQDGQLVKTRNQHIELHFLLGKLLDRRADYDAAFAAFQAGSRLKHKRYDGQVVSDLVDALIETFSPERFAGMPRLQGSGEQQIFIVGMPRSGSTLVEQIVSSHRDVAGAGEVAFMPELVSAMPDVYPVNLLSMAEPSLQDLAHEYLQRMQPFTNNRRYVTDKMLVNFMHLGLINLLFPAAHVIHCARDPLDTCLSCYCQNFAAQLNYAYDLSDLAHYYRQYRRLMRHWQTVLDMPLLTMNYEELVQQQEVRTRELLNFLGLDWDEHCLYFYLNRRPVLTASYDQVRHPLYRDGLQRWRHYRDHLGPLIAGLDGELD
jgi:tetratricopeptide (TPR) repeat protein